MRIPSLMVVILVMACSALAQSRPAYLLSNSRSAEPFQMSAAAGDSLEELEREFEEARTEYLKILHEHLPGVYRKHLAKLSKQDMATVASARRLWQWYIESGPFTMGDPRKQRTGIFRQEFLDPMNRVAEILLLDPATFREATVNKARAKAFKVGERLRRARQKAGVDIDPTVDKTAPTGIPLPRLDSPHTCIDRLKLYERTLVLVRTVAHPAAEKALMQNAAVCADLDLEEADFVMYANQVRMLSGSIAWVADPMMTACCRDHSHDRKAGDASGHQSKLPGKKFPRDRAKRFGCRVGPEGAGGGRDGAGALRGLAYNGTGHGGPLFAMLRNVVGPGWRQGALTAMYQTDNGLKHECAATEREMVLPPGVTAEMLSGTVGKVFLAMVKQDFAKAHDLLDGRAPKDEFQKAVWRYLEARVQAEVDWTLTGVERFMNVGDAFAAQQRLELAKRRMDGIGTFDRRAKALSARLSTKLAKRELEVGKVYYKVISAREISKDHLRELMSKYPKSAYAAAAKHCLEAGKGSFWPELFYFVMQDTHLNKWSYLDKVRLGMRR